MDKKNIYMYRCICKHFRFNQGKADVVLYNLPCFCRLSPGRIWKWPVIIGTLSAVTLLSMSTLIIVLLRRQKSQQYEEDPRAVAKSSSANRISLFQSQYPDKGNIEGQINLNVNVF